MTDPADARARLVALTGAGRARVDATHGEQLRRWRSSLLGQTRLG